LLALKLAFRKAEKKKEGKLSVSEFKELMKQLIETECIDRNVKPEIKERIEKLMAYVPDLFDHLDADEDGMLSERELCTLGMYGSITDLENMLGTAVVYAIDKDNDGVINAKELKEMLMKVTPPDEHGFLEFGVMMFMMSVADGPGTVSIDALVEYKTKQLKGEGGKDPKDKYKLLFRMLDTNKDNTISRKELQTYFGKESGMEKGVLDEMLKAVEKKGDEKLNYADFSAILDKQK